MILSAHFLVGAAISSEIGNPYAGLFLAYLSHYFFDLLPVWEYDISQIKGRQWKKSRGDFLKVFLDILFGISLFFIFSKNILIGFLGGFLTAIPDSLTLLCLLFPKIKLLQEHSKIHKKLNWFRTKKIPLVLRILNTLLVYSAAILFLQQL